MIDSPLISAVLANIITYNLISNMVVSFILGTEYYQAQFQVSERKRHISEISSTRESKNRMLPQISIDNHCLPSTMVVDHDTK